ncbi:MAG: nitroreductase [Gammaproteobacteria bacterium]|nr:nitroreductase [Gammaproteobacteria bacterium]
MELFDAIMSRTSAARLTAPGPGPDQLAAIVAAADRAPDHGRLRPWRVAVLDEAARERVATAAVEARRARLPAPNDDQLRVEREKFTRSPVLIIVGCVVVRDHPKVPEIEQILAAGAAVQNMCLAAHALNFGAMWKTGPAAYDPGVKAAVGLGRDDHIVAILHLGTREK